MGEVKNPSNVVDHRFNCDLTCPDNTNAVFEAFTNDGFVVLSEAIPPHLLKEWQQFGEEYFQECFEILHRQGHTRASTHKIENDLSASMSPMSDGESIEGGYVLGLGAKHGFREIVMRSPGRYELGLLGLLEQQEQGSSVRARVPETRNILHLLETLLPSLLGKTKGQMSDLKQCHLSLLVATPGSPDQKWHADGPHMSLEQHLPSHCFNVFIPLQDTPLELGPTEFRPGGHFLTRGNLARQMLAAKCRKALRPPVWPTLVLGDVVIFDYRILHRGRANHSRININRNVLVFTFCEPWFDDVLNFPKRTMMVPTIER